MDCSMNCSNGKSRRRSRRREEPTWRDLVDAMIGRNTLRSARTVKVISAPLINNNNNSDCDSSSPATTMSPPLTEDIPGAPFAFTQECWQNNIIIWIQLIRGKLVLNFARIFRYNMKEKEMKPGERLNGMIGLSLKSLNSRKCCTICLLKERTFLHSSIG